MPYIRRNADGQIESLHRHEGEGFGEFVDSQHEEIQGFLGRAPEEAGFSRLDADFVRVIEDLIDTLLSRNILNITDLPAEAQHKLFARKTFRDRATKNSLQLFNHGGLDDVI